MQKAHHLSIWRHACALLLAAQAAVNLMIKECTFYTDCKLLADTFETGRRSQHLLTTDWRSFNQLLAFEQIIATKETIVVFSFLEKKIWRPANWQTGREPNSSPSLNPPIHSSQTQIVKNLEGLGVLCFSFMFYIS